MPFQLRGVSTSKIEIAMRNILRIGNVFLLILASTACASAIPKTTAPPTSSVTPTITANTRVPTFTRKTIATGTTRDDEPIIVITFNIVEQRTDVQGNLLGYRTANKMQVSRADSVSWLKSANTPDAFGCGIEQGTYENFGCYFGSAILVDLDQDGEPEILSQWEHNGSAGVQSLHIYRWDGKTYQLLDVLAGMSLEFDTQDLNQEGRPELILHYYVGIHQLPVPWIDVYSVLNRQLLLVNKQYPRFYQELLAQYQQMLPDFEAVADKGWAEALVELKRRIEMAKAIVANNSP